MALLFLPEFLFLSFIHLGKVGSQPQLPLLSPKRSHSSRGSSGGANWGWLCTEPEEPQTWGLLELSGPRSLSKVGLESTLDQLSHDFTQLSLKNLHGQ